MASRIDEAGERAKHAENLGFTSAWFGDSPMIWSDVYACLALAAEATSTIAIGTGVSVTSLRQPPVTAASIASINQIAPGRTFLGLGTGHTAVRTMGQRPTTIDQFDHDAAVITALLRGERVEYERAGRRAPIELMEKSGVHFNVEDRIPVYIAASGPRARRVAAKYADGLIDGLPATPETTAESLSGVREMAAEEGRALPADFPYICSPGGSIIVVEDHEDLTSDRVKGEAGPQVMLRLHARYQAREAGGGTIPGGVFPDLPPDAERDWERYCAMLDAYPAAERHLRVHSGHGMFVHPDEWEFVTPALISAITLTGRPDELIERLRAYDEQGLKEWMLAPGDEHRYSNLERFSRLVMSRL